MTANQMSAYFDLLKDGSMFIGRTFNEREKSQFLTVSQLQFAKNHLSIPGNKLSGISSGHVEFTAANDDFMRGTKANAAYRTPDLDAAPDDVQAFGHYVRIPNEVLMITRENCDLEKEGRIIPQVPVMPFDPVMYNSYIYDELKQPAYDTVWGIDYGSFTPAGTLDSTTSAKSFTGVSIRDNTFEVTIDTDRAKCLIPGKGYNLYSYSMNYIKAPAAIVVNLRDPLSSVDPELPAIYHEEIVMNALKLAAISMAPDAGSEYQIADKEVKEAN